MCARHRWQYGACAWDAGYPSLQTHTQNMQYLRFSTATVVAQTRLSVKVYVHCLSCYLCITTWCDIRLCLLSYTASWIVDVAGRTTPTSFPLLPFTVCTGCFTTLGHNCRRWFSRFLWSKKFIWKCVRFWTVTEVWAFFNSRTRPRVNRV